MTDATKLTPIVCKADVFDEGVGCVLGVIENHSVRPLTRDELEQLIARLGEAEKQIAALTAEVELLRKVKVLTYVTHQKEIHEQD